MNRYSENIAELLLLGRTELDDFHAARGDLDEGLRRLRNLGEQELALLRGPDERAREATEVERVDAMRALFEGIDLTTQRLLFLREQGQREEAVRLFREEIEDRLDAELEALMAAAIADEEEELRAIERRTAALETRLALLVAGVALLALAVSAAAGVALTRALTKPIGELIAATRAIGEGDLAYRVSDRRRDEFADLARQFNRTAGRLEGQRRRLLEVQASLEHEVARRTGELEEANTRLQRLDQMRMLFLADISHELRTPLTVLRGEAEVALRGERSREEHREALGLIVQLAAQMGRLVEDLLFLARAEVGAVRFEMQPLDLADVLEIAAAEGQALAEAGGRQLRAHWPALACRVRGDAERLLQALLIVLDNAAKYSEPGGLIELAARLRGAEVELSVRNTGPGIPPGELPFVFNRFHRGPQGATSSTPGTGLGLSIAKWIVDTHGGRIAIDSRDGTTVVTLRLPTEA